MGVEGGGFTNISNRKRILHCRKYNCDLDPVFCLKEMNVMILCTWRKTRGLICSYTIYSCGKSLGNYFGKINPCNLVHGTAPLNNFSWITNCKKVFTQLSCNLITYECVYRWISFIFSKINFRCNFTLSERHRSKFYSSMNFPKCIDMYKLHSSQDRTFVLAYDILYAPF